MIPEKTIEDLITRHSLLEKDLASGKIEKKLFAEKSKEYADLNEIINIAKKYQSFEKDKSELEKILNEKNTDEELLSMAKIELENLKVENHNNEKALKLFLIPKDEADKKKLADTELSELKDEYERNEKKLKLFLLPKDEADKKKCDHRN